MGWFLSRIILTLTLSSVLHLMGIPEVRGQDTLRLSPDLILPARLFGRAFDLAVDRTGHLFVSDSRAYRIYRFDAQGTPLDTIGRRGEGPGEFKDRWIGLSYLPATDVLYAFEPLPRRLHAWKLQPNVHLLNTHVLSTGDIGVLLALWAWSPDTLILYEQRTRLSPLQSAYTLWLYRWSNRQRSLLFTLSPPEALRTESSVVSLPFMPRTLVDIHPPFGIATLWNDSLVVRLRDLQGHVRAQRRLPLHRRVPIPQTTWEQELERLRRRAPVPLRTSHLKQLQRTFWPYVADLLLDDRGRVWARLYPDSPTWTVYWTEGRGFVALQGKVTLKVIRQHHAWGIRYEEDGLTSVVRFRLPEDPN